MSINKYQKHVLVLPEDDANRQLANGFVLDAGVLTRKVQILPEAGGLNEVLDSFTSDHVPQMTRYPDRHIILIMDFDRDPNRLARVQERIPANVKERVFVLGVLSEPEDLKADLGPYEAIGLAMAKDCREHTEVVWSHPLLRHNGAQIERLQTTVSPFLFGNV